MITCSEVYTHTVASNTDIMRIYLSGCTQHGFIIKECCINPDGVNPKYIEECYCAKGRRNELCKMLQAKKYGADEAMELSLQEGSNTSLSWA